MSDSEDSTYRNITLNDVQLASAYYPILIDLAKHKRRLTYGELVDRAKEEYPNRPAVQNAIPVSTGRRLDVIRLFTDERGLPDLTSLVIGKGSGECGSGFTDRFNPETERAKVFEKDWNSVSTDFDGFIRHSVAAVTPRKRIKRPAALSLMSEHYSKHRAELPPNIAEKRELILELLMEGFSAEGAFAEALKTSV